jgi:glucan biosynthesis protein C
MQRRLLFVSRYRGFLIVLIVLIHTGITYGAAGSWYYTEQNGVLWLKALGTFIGAVAQSFALGAFFFLSAYFLPSSLEHRGPWGLIRERSVRLLIPLGIYSFIANPLLVMAVAAWGRGSPIPLGPWFGTGPLWFVEALYLFMLVYLAGKLLLPRGIGMRAPGGIPSRRAILLYIPVAAALGFLVRTVFPVGSGISNLQPGFFPMYIILFATGIKAGREQWLEDIASVPIGFWAILAGLGLITFPLLGIAGGALHHAAAFLGGFTWQSAAYALWEAATGTALLVVTLVLFSRARWITPGIGESFSSSSYGIYLLHSFFVVLLALAMKGLAVHPAVKWMTLSICGVCLPWLLTLALRRVPGFSRVF